MFKRRPIVAQPPRWPLVGAVLAIPVWTAACDDLRPLRPLGADLSRPQAAPVDRVPLVPLSLDSQAALDAFEEAWLPRPGKAALLAFLDELIDRRGFTSPLVMQRAALVAVDLAVQRRVGPDEAIRTLSRLRDAHPESLEALFLEGWMPLRFIRVDDDFPLTLSDELRSLVDSVRRPWRALLARVEGDPAFIGPRGIDAVRIEALLAELDAAAGARLDAGRPRPAPGQGPAETLSPTRLRALDTLRRFESAPDGERRGLCSAWPRELLEAPEGPEVAHLALHCARASGDLRGALAGLGALITERGLDAVQAPLCRVWEQLAEDFGRKALEAEASGLGLQSRCER